MTRKLGGKNNAIRHGAYTEDLLLPGECAEEFERLHQGLIEELKPNGTLEEHTVRAIAENIWRKTRGERFLIGNRHGRKRIPNDGKSTWRMKSCVCLTRPITRKRQGN